MYKAYLGSLVVALLLVLITEQASIDLGESRLKEATQTPLLSSEKQKKVDQALRRWEEWNLDTSTFECRFKYWKYDPVFRPNEPKQIGNGTIFYFAPHQMKFVIDFTKNDENNNLIDRSQAEKWAFDGKAIKRYDNDNRKVKAYDLLPDVNPDNLVDGPLSFLFAVRIFPIIASSDNRDLSPFPFSSMAEVLKRHYAICITTPEKSEGETWLEAYPRTKDVAACCSKIQLIFNSSDMSPFAMRIVEPNGKNYSVYQFYDIKRNHIDISCR